MAPTKEFRAVGWGGGKPNEADCDTVDEAREKAREFILKGKCSSAEIFRRDTTADFVFVGRIRKAAKK